MEDSEISVLLLCSSLIFMTNICTTFYHTYYIYCFLFCCLTISSLMFHYNPNHYTNAIDKLCILAIVSYGGYILYEKTTLDNQSHVWIVVTTFVSCLFLFFYGYFVNDYCYHPDKNIGDMYHCILHIIGSLGHHLILFL